MCRFNSQKTGHTGRIGLLVLALAITGLAQAQLQPPAQAQVPQDMAIFGDSLSDTGNKHAIRGLLSVPPYNTLNEFGVPIDPYGKGGIHFSNGRSWVEHVAGAIGAGGSARPALASNGKAANYAWGGARAFPIDNEFGNRHLPEQVSTYLADVNYAVSPDTLHVIFIGGNDMIEALQILAGSQPGGFPGAIARVAAAATSVQENVQALVDAGARRFLILNAPNVGLVPAIANPGGKFITSCFSQLYNTGTMDSPCPAVALPTSLQSIADNLRGMDGMEVTTVDVYGFISGIAANPGGYGLSNATQMCVTPLVAPYDCKSPNEYLFWDGIHPTKTVHRLLASLVLNQLDP